MKWQAIAGASALKAVGSLALRFTAQRDRIDRSWLSDIGPKLSAIGEVDQLVNTSCRAAGFIRSPLRRTGCVLPPPGGSHEVALRLRFQPQWRSAFCPRSQRGVIKCGPTAVGWRRDLAPACRPCWRAASGIPQVVRVLQWCPGAAWITSIRSHADESRPC